ncbi:MAG TPA: hypothetical protein VFT49_00090 [Candidatus Saccharimonadales bacterium]|nr:hypothetical protein [Candidatus Saccharimonadales bacterium]
MKFKLFSAVFAGVLAALLVNDYRAAIGHFVAYQIPWHDKLFWPLASGELAWILVAEVFVGLLMWFVAHWFEVEDNGYTFSLYIIVSIVEMMACVPAFRIGYIVFGLTSLVFGLATFVALTSSSFWNEDSEQVGKDTNPLRRVA